MAGSQFKSLRGETVMGMILVVLGAVSIVPAALVAVGYEIAAVNG
jgi:hypothetical protein